MELEIALVAVLLAAAVAILQFGLHKVPEGTVGVYYRGGALMNTIAAPGYHMQAPFITRFEAIQVNIQTDLVRDIPCGTNGGTVINFEKIEVVNRLDRSKVHDTIQNYGVNYDKTWIYQDPPRDQPVLFRAHARGGIHLAVRHRRRAAYRTTAKGLHRVEHGHRDHLYTRHEAPYTRRNSLQL